MSSIIIEYYENSKPVKLQFSQPLVVIGSNERADVKLFDPSVGPQHATISSANGSYSLNVVSPSYYTAVNGQVVSAGSVPLTGAAQIQIGSVPIRFTPGQPAVSTGFSASASLGFQPSNAPFGFQSQGTPTGFGSPNATPSGFGSTSGFSTPNNASQGLFGSPTPASKDSGDPNDPNRIVTWDEIADSVSDDEASEPIRTESVFDKISAADAKGKEVTEKPNPALVLLAVLAVGYIGYIFIFDSGPSEGTERSEKSFEDLPYITWAEADIECAPAADCIDKAKRATRIGLDMYDKKGVQPGFLFESYRNFDRAKQYLQVANEAVFPELEKAQTTSDAARNELDLTFRQLRARYLDAEKRKMYDTMADVIVEIEQRYPYKGARENRWANTKREQMIRREIFPRRPDF